MLGYSSFVLFTPHPHSQYPAAPPPAPTPWPRHGHPHDPWLLTTAAEDETETPKRAQTGLTGWIDCYPKSRLAGTLFCGGVNDPREIEGNPKLQEAFDLGKSIG